MSTLLKPQAEHCIPILEVRRLYCERSGNSTAARNTVNDWLKRRRVRSFGPSDKLRLFDRAAVIAALEADFSPEPQFITVEDAFLLAGLPYPNARKNAAL
jgi:hypothetical protein